MNQIVFESSARLLTLLHGFAGIALTGALTHGAVFIWKGNRTGAAGYYRRAEKFWPVIHISLFASMLLGFIAYPTYRIRTRAEFLDAHYPLVVDLFDLKENYASIVFVLVIGAWLLRHAPLKSQARQLLHDNFYYAATTLTWLIAVLGLWVTLHRGIGT